MKMSGEERFDEARASLRLAAELNQTAFTEAARATLKKLDRNELVHKLVKAAARKKYQEVIRICTSGIESNRLESEYLAECYSSRSAAFSKFSEYDKALADIDKAIGINPNHAGAHINRGSVLIDFCKRGEDRFDEARASVRRAMELDPELPSIHDMCGMIKEIDALEAKNGAPDVRRRGGWRAEAAERHDGSHRRGGGPQGL